MRGVLIDYDDAVRLVNDEIVKESSDYVYELPSGVCYNVIEDSDGKLVGSCLVGRALVAAGVDPGRFSEMEIADAQVSKVVSALPELGVTYKAMQFLDVVQARQDFGYSWGEAVEMAIALANHSDYPELDDETFI